MKGMMERRGFLKALAAVGVAGKQVTTELTKTALGSPEALMGIRDIAGSGNELPGPLHHNPSKSSLEATIRHLATFGIPKAVMRNLRRRAEWVHAMDPDLAAMRSWSLSAKMLEQRRRNLERLVEEYHSKAHYALVEAIFAEEHKELSLPYV